MASLINHETVLEQGQFLRDYETKAPLNESELKVRTTQIRKLYDTLYNFSLDKVTVCFETPPICVLFQIYKKQIKLNK